jgi:Ca2+-binding EF-hand superfamily protein
MSSVSPFRSSSNLPRTPVNTAVKPNSKSSATKYNNFTPGSNTSVNRVRNEPGSSGGGIIVSQVKSNDSSPLLQSYSPHTPIVEINSRTPFPTPFSGPFSANKPQNIVTQTPLTVQQRRTPNTARTTQSNPATNKNNPSNISGIRIACNSDLHNLYLSSSNNDVDEVEAMLQSVFKLNDSIIGLYESHNKVIYPFSLVCSNADSFKDIYLLVTEAGVVPAAAASDLHYSNNNSTAQRHLNYIEEADNLAEGEDEEDELIDDDGDDANSYNFPEFNSVAEAKQYVVQQAQQWSSTNQARPAQRQERKKWDLTSPRTVYPSERELQQFEGSTVGFGMFQLSAAELLELEGLQQRIGLSHLSARRLYAFFRKVAQEYNNTLPRSVFDSLVVNEISSYSQSVAGRNECWQVFDRLFDILDVEDSGSILYSDFACGLTLLCPGKQSEKIRLAFDSYDYTNSNCISFHSLCKYFISFFIVAFDLSTQLQRIAEQDEITIEELGIATAKQCYKDLQLNRHEKIEFRQFFGWYTSGYSEEEEQNEYYANNNFAAEEEAAESLSAYDSLSSDDSESEVNTYSEDEYSQAMQYLNQYNNSNISNAKSNRATLQAEDYLFTPANTAVEELPRFNYSNQRNTAEATGNRPLSRRKVAEPQSPLITNNDQNSYNSYKAQHNNYPAGINSSL